MKGNWQLIESLEPPSLARRVWGRVRRVCGSAIARPLVERPATDCWEHRLFADALEYQLAKVRPRFDALAEKQRCARRVCRSLSRMPGLIKWQVVVIRSVCERFHFWEQRVAAVEPASEVAPLYDRLRGLTVPWFESLRGLPARLREIIEHAKPGDHYDVKLDFDAPSLRNLPPLDLRGASRTVGDQIAGVVAALALIALGIHVLGHGDGEE